MALSAARNTPTRAIKSRISIPLKATATVYEGGMVAIDSNGYGIAATVAATYQGVLIATKTATGGSGDGDISVDCVACEAYMANYGSDLVAETNLLQNCYVYDDATVAATDGGSARSVAGTVTGVDSGGVWVSFGTSL